MAPRKIGKVERKLNKVARLAKRRGVPAQDSTDVHLPPYVGDFGAIQRQVYLEYNLDWNYMRPKIQKWLARLKLYNNQRRDEEKVGEPLIYDTHQTVMSVLCGDKMAVEFTGRLEDEQDQAENLNLLAENDYEEMRKQELDYEWNWDAGFFGSGLVLMNDFDTDSKTPIPTVIDPTTFIRNPGAKWVNGNRAGEGALLYGGYEVKLTESMMRSNPKTDANPNGYFNLDKLLKTNDLFSLSGEASRLRREAQGMNDIFTFENSIVENYEYSILRWFTHVPDPKTGISKKYIVEVANNRMLPIRVIELKRDFWPIIQKKFSPIAHDWDGVSIPDLVEDKQRFKATILNDLGDIVKAEVKPMYLFHEDRFRKTQDFTIKWGKWLPVKGPGGLNDAAQALQTKQISPTVQYVLNYLDQSAKAASGTPDIQQGNQPKDQPLGNTQIQVQGLSNRHSLTSQIFEWAEKEFWKQWYFKYEDDFDAALGEKMIRFNGMFGPKWVPIKRDDIITGNTLGPGITIESKVFSEAKKLRELQMLQGYVQQIAQDPRVNFDATYTYRKLGKLILSKQECERILPLSIDEYEALAENDNLSENEKERVMVPQNHQVHLRVHAQGEDTPAMRQHIKLHIHMLMEKRSNPSAFPQLPGDANPAMGGQAGGGATPPNPQLMNPIQKINPPQEGVARPS